MLNKIFFFILFIFSSLFAFSQTVPQCKLKVIALHGNSFIPYSAIELYSPMKPVVKKTMTNGEADLLLSFNNKHTLIVSKNGFVPQKFELITNLPLDYENYTFQNLILKVYLKEITVGEPVNSTLVTAERLHVDVTQGKISKAPNLIAINDIPEKSILYPLFMNEVVPQADTSIMLPHNGDTANLAYGNKPVKVDIIVDYKQFIERTIKENNVFDSILKVRKNIFYQQGFHQKLQRFNLRSEDLQVNNDLIAKNDSIGNIIRSNLGTANDTLNFLNSNLELNEQLLAGAKNYLQMLKNKSDVNNNDLIMAIQAFILQLEQEVILVKEKLLQTQDDLIIRNQEIKIKNFMISMLVGGTVLLLTILLITYLLLRSNKKTNNILLNKNAVINQQNEEISAQRDDILRKNGLLEYQKGEITASINYAKRIQNALLPSENLLYSVFPESFILFKPRDIVSGDFYWMKKINDYFVVATVDCTGHGVPGAFMSILGISFLNEIVSRVKFDKPADILSRLRDKLKKALHQTGQENETSDGMDISLCIIDLETKELQFAGAFNDVYIVRNKELIKLKGNRQPIAIFLRETNFENHNFQLLENDILYLFTDGYADQFGGKKLEKFKMKKLTDLFVNMNNENLQQQKIILDTAHNEWKGTEEQIDDILVIGLKISDVKI